MANESGASSNSGGGQGRNPPPARIRLENLASVRREMSKVYRDMRAGRVSTADGTKLAYVLRQVADLIESSDLERRIQILEDQANGK
jgi:hypothetical protein